MFLLDLLDGGGVKCIKCAKSSEPQPVRSVCIGKFCKFIMIIKAWLS